MIRIAREGAKVDRIACPRRITRFIDPQSELPLVTKNGVLSTAERLRVIPFDVEGVELGHHGGKGSFDAIVSKFRLNRTRVGGT